VIALAALDLRGGRAVQLVGGVPGTERVRLDSPLEVAAHWVDCGFRGLHVVDLDAALGAGDNRGLTTRLLELCPVPVQVGGGLRDDDSVQAMLDTGAVRAIVGTRALEDPAWLERLATRHPDRIVVAADLRDGVVVTHGWTADTRIRPDRLLAELATLPLAAILVTDVGREGRVQGVDRSLFANLAAGTTHPLQAAGGIRDVADLRALSSAGVRGAVLGMALYTGAIDARATATEFPE
jgi:phosphoribosylformimino-5-aminoimidazole carboxamide ribotide isomerase